MSGAPVVLVLMTDGVGGAEKRLSEVWLHLAPRMPELRMIVRASTFAQLCARPDLAGLAAYRDRVTTVDTKAASFPAACAAFAPALWRLPRGSVVHHILQALPFLHQLRGHRVLLSWVATEFPDPKASRAARNNWLMSKLSLRQSTRIDVLNPEILAKFADDPALAEKASLTAGGTIIDGETFKPGTKRDEVVFMGRIERFKNALAFVEAMPAIDAAVRAKGKRAAFRIYGKAADQGEAVRALLDSVAYRDLDVSWGHTDDPASALAPAKVFLSLQSPSNYPSKALAEAMAAGCVPVISDSGESRRMADASLARFVPKDFTANELAAAVADVLALDDDAFAKKSAAIRAGAMARFRIEPQADYFENLYRTMAR